LGAVAEAAFLPTLRDFVYALRAADRSLRELPDYAPPVEGAGITFYSI
jgi:hypothetical protein